MSYAPKLLTQTEHLTILMDARKFLIHIVSRIIRNRTKNKGVSQMAVTTIEQPCKLTRVQFTIPAESTLPITYTVDGITSSMTVIVALTSNAYVFQGLTATASNGSVTIDGTRWGTYDDDVTIELIFAETASSTATAIVAQSGE